MDVIERAKLKREALQKELRRLDDWIKMAEAMDAELQNPTANAGGTTPSAAPAGKPLSTRARVEAAVADLIKTNGPMKKRDIYDRLEQMGISPGTSNPSVMLSIILSRSDFFTNDKERGVWRLTKGKSPTGVNH